MKAAFRLTGLVFSGTIGLIFICASAYATVRWVMEIIFYWRNGWNFDLPHPDVPFQKMFSGPDGLSKLGRLVLGWPFEIARYGAYAALVYFLYMKIIFPTAPQGLGLTPLTMRLLTWLTLGLLAFGLALKIYISVFAA